MYENRYAGFRVAEQRQADGGIYSFHYNFFNVLTPGTSPIQMTTVINPNARRTSYRFDPSGQLLQVTHQDELRLYPAADPRPAEGKDRRLTIQPFPKRVTKVEGDAQCSSCGNAQAGDVQNVFDLAGNLTTHRDAHGNTSTFEYEPVFSRLTASTNALGHRSEMVFDGRGNLVSAKDPNLNINKSSYNAFGQVIELTDALLQKTKLEYDTFGNLIAVTDALGHKSLFRYDAVSRLLETVDSVGRRTQTFYDNLDRVTKTIDGRGVSTLFNYDLMSNLVMLTDGRGKKTILTYDESNRLATRTDPLGKVETRSYDFLGNLRTFVDRG